MKSDPLEIRWHSKQRKTVKGHYGVRHIANPRTGKTVESKYWTPKSHRIEWYGRLKNGCAIHVYGTSRSYIVDIWPRGRPVIVSEFGSTPEIAVRRAVASLREAIRARIDAKLTEIMELRGLL